MRRRKGEKQKEGNPPASALPLKEERNEDASLAEEPSAQNRGKHGQNESLQLTLWLLLLSLMRGLLHSLEALSSLLRSLVRGRQGLRDEPMGLARRTSLAEKEVTPMALFLHHLEQCKYEEALALAQTHGFDTDVIYQKQWATEPVNKQSIKNCLNKVYDKEWVLWQCHHRIPHSPHANRLLLRYGLQISVPSFTYGQTAASLSIPSKLSQKDKELCLHRLLFLQYLRRLDTFQHINACNNVRFDAAEFLEFRNSDLVAKAKTYALKENLEALQVLLARHKEELLPFLLDILALIPETTDPALYADLLPSPALSELQFTVNLPSSSPSTESRSRSQQQNDDEGKDEEEAEFGNGEEDWVERTEVLEQLGLSGAALKDDVSYLRSYLWRWVRLQQRATESASLQAVSTEGEATTNSDKHRRRSDTPSRRALFSNTKDVYDLSLSSLSSESQQQPRKPNPLPELPSATLIQQWYLQRVRQIDSLSGRLDHCLALIELALQKSGAPEQNASSSDPSEVSHMEKTHMDALQAMRSHLLSLNVLAYNCFMEEITLQTYEKLSDYDRMQLFLRRSTDETILEDLQTLVLPFFDRMVVDSTTAIDDKSLKEKESIAQDLLCRYLVDLANAGRFVWCARIIEQSKPTDENERQVRIIRDPVHLMRAALSCVYACPSPQDYWPQLNTIFESLPAREHLEHTIHGGAEEERALHDRVDRFEIHLAADELLEKYDLVQPFSFFVEMDSVEDKSAASTLLCKMTQKLVKSKPAAAKQAWLRLLEDMLFLRQHVFPYISEEDCHKYYCQALLLTGRFELVEKYLHQTHDPEAVALEASRLHFNAAANAQDQELDLAQKCLEIVPLSVEVNKELDLIEAVRMLSEEYNFTKLPVQIRLSLNSLPHLFHEVLELNPTCFQQPDKLLQLATLLGASLETKRWVQLLLVRTAMRAGDHATAFSLCIHIISLDYVEVAPLCAELAMNDQYKDYQARLQLITFALEHCDVDEVSPLLSLYNELEAREVGQSIGCVPSSIEENETAATTPSSISSEDTTSTATVRNSRGLLSGQEELEEAAQAQKTKFFTGRLSLVSAQIARKLYAERVEGEMSSFLPSAEIPFFPTHPFYMTTNTVFDEKESDTFSYGSPPLMGASGRKVPETELEIVQWLYHLHCLTSNDTGADVRPMLASRLFSEDLPISLAFLLSIYSDRELDSSGQTYIQSLLEQTEEQSNRQQEDYVRIGCYLIALHCLHLLHTKNAITSDSITILRKIYGLGVRALIQHFEKTSQELMREENLESLRRSHPALLEELHPLLSQFQKNLSLLQHSVQERVVKDLSDQIPDMKRFTSNSKYREHVLLSLARTTDVSDITAALTLARRYHVPEWQLALECLIHLSEQRARRMTTTGSSLAELQQVIFKVLSRAASNKESATNHMEKMLHRIEKMVVVGENASSIYNTLEALYKTEAVRHALVHCFASPVAGDSPWKMLQEIHLCVFQQLLQSLEKDENMQRLLLTNPMVQLSEQARTIVKRPPALRFPCYQLYWPLEQEHKEAEDKQKAEEKGDEQDIHVSPALLLSHMLRNVFSFNASSAFNEDDEEAEIEGDEEERAVKTAPEMAVLRSSILSKAITFAAAVPIRDVAKQIMQENEASQEDAATKTEESPQRVVAALQGRIIALELILHNVKQAAAATLFSGEEEEKRKQKEELFVSLLAYFRTCSTVVEGWGLEEAEAWPLNATDEQRAELLSSLIARVSSAEDYLQIQHLHWLLVFWTTRNTVAPSPFHRCWHSFFQKLLAVGELGLLSNLRREVSHCSILTSEEEEEILQRLAERVSSEDTATATGVLLECYYTFGLLSHNETTRSQTVKRMLSDVNKKQKSPKTAASPSLMIGDGVLSTILTQRLLPKFVHSAEYWPRLVSFLLSFPENRIEASPSPQTEEESNGECHHSLRMAVVMLCAERMYAHAAGLVGKSMGLPSSFLTMNNVLPLLRSFLSKSLHHSQQEESEDGGAEGTSNKMRWKECHALARQELQKLCF
ncbi:putative Neuroblastomaamplified protein [Balamuthia mandrillaris]